MDLSALGWISARAEHLAARYPGLLPGRVSAQNRGAYRLLTADGERAAVLGGKLRHAAPSAGELPAVGDWVAFAPPRTSARVIQAVLPRATAFAAQSRRRGIDEQLVAANVDVVFLVSGLDGDFNLRRIERYLTLAWDSGAQPVILLNKADLRADVEDVLDELRRPAAGRAGARRSPALAGDGLEPLRAVPRAGAHGGDRSARRASASRRW